MKALIWHCKYFKIKNHKLFLNITIDQEPKNIEENNVIVPWITIETQKDEKCFKKILKDIIFLKERFNTNKVILTPFAHLSNKNADINISYEILNKLEIFLTKNNFNVTRVHFGSSKDTFFESEADKYQVIFRSY
ncbi:MAG: threonyl-tRNA synthetase editing domain-containing protein [archaeon]